MTKAQIKALKKAVSILEEYYSSEDNYETAVDVHGLVPDTCMGSLDDIIKAEGK